MSDDEIRINPHDALRMLLESEGFSLFIEHVRSEWGNAAVLRRIAEALKEHPSADHSALTQSILGTSDTIKKLFAWPEEEMHRLKARALDEQVDMYAKHRRTA